MHALRLGTVLALATILLACLAPAASAHATATTADGRFRITWGLLEEPGFTGEKNRLDLILRDNATGEGVAGITGADLRVSLKYGDETYDLGNVTAYRGAKGANAGAGNYTSANPVYLTRPGIYVLHVEGAIHGSAVSLDIPAKHEYEAMEEIHFPALDATLEERVAALEAEVAALKAQAKAQSETPATVSPQPTGGAPVPALGLLATLAAVALVALRRKA